MEHTALGDFLGNLGEPLAFFPIVPHIHLQVTRSPNTQILTADRGFTGVHLTLHLSLLVGRVTVGEGVRLSHEDLLSVKETEEWKRT